MNEKQKRLLITDITDLRLDLIEEPQNKEVSFQIEVTGLHTDVHVRVPRQDLARLIRPLFTELDDSSESAPENHVKAELRHLHEKIDNLYVCPGEVAVEVVNLIDRKYDLPEKTG